MLTVRLAEKEQPRTAAARIAVAATISSGRSSLEDGATPGMVCTAVGGVKALSFIFWMDQRRGIAGGGREPLCCTRHALLDKLRREPGEPLRGRCRLATARGREGLC